MRIVKCQNVRVQKHHPIKCGRFAVVLPLCVIDSLKENPGQKIITRCPTCPSFHRWGSLYYNEDGKLVWETLSGTPDLNSFPDIVPDIIISSETVG